MYLVNVVNRISQKAYSNFLINNNYLPYTIVTVGDQDSGREFPSSIIITTSEISQQIQTQVQQELLMKKQQEFLLHLTENLGSGLRLKLVTSYF